MKITILCVGKVKEKFYRDAIAEYSKRLSRYCKLEITEVSDEKTSEQATQTEIDIVKIKKVRGFLKYKRRCICILSGDRWKAA